jgi:hypothetical protein
LLWGADLLADRSACALAPAAWRLLIEFVVLGAVGAVYDLALTHAYPILADRGLVPPLDWMAPDRQFGPRTYAARTAYEWARSSSAETAAIQFNPKVAFEVRRSAYSVAVETNSISGVSSESDIAARVRGDRVWREKAAFQSPYVRIFRCRNPHLGKASAGD